MVDEVFALSPISARAAQPNETDYEAIRDAFMETARGRWFLGEYAKRNRNADTSMVLDAVARIEHALASQREQQQDLEQADSKALPEALAAIRAAVEDAALAAASAVDRMALEQNLAPVRKGTRIIKEISWRWREIGADSRICDLIDSQVTSIEAACDQLASVDPKAALLAAFEIIKTRLKELDEGQATASLAPEETVPAASAAPSSTLASAPMAEAPLPMAEDIAREPAPEPAAPPVVAANSPLVEAVAAIEAIGTPAATAAVMVAEMAVENPATDPETAAVAMPLSPIALAEIVAEPSIAEALVEIEQQSPGETEDAAAAEAQDEAILDLVAAAMGAPDPIEEEEFNRSRTLGFDIAEPTSIDDDIVASFGEPPSTEPPSSERAPSAPPSFEPPSLEPELAPTTAKAPAASTAAPAAHEPAAAPPIALAPLPSPPVAATQLPESIAAETLAAVAAAVAPQAEIASPRHVPHAPVAPQSTTTYPMLKPAYEPSLGSTLLTNGLLQRSQAPANDPLSPIRRMSQPEKIAFFS
ncbi:MULTISPECIES: hypothetical protein [unclassified Bradyrhizobium]|uniref:hypothetical protein n=1 Tax=unclassified Bradyrhizobium TaxID=2631580 RepID=UPI0024E0ABA4|nr:MULTISPECIES: hypothetical protein [unclassified Bradyrhizobium]